MDNGKSQEIKCEGFIVQVENWFSLPIWYGEIDIDLDSIQTYCLNMEKEIESSKFSNVGGWQSGDVSNIEFFKPLKEKIQEKVDLLSNQIDKKFKVNVTNVWVNVNRKGHYNVPHTHPCSTLSGCFYIATPENSGKIMFDSPDTGKMHYTIETFNSNLFICEVTHTPSPKKIIVFPSWLPHRVEANQSDEPRISISFNTFQTIH